MRYLLDTNIVSNIMRSPHGTAAMRLREVGGSRVCTSSIVSAQLLFGGYKRGSASLIERVTDTLSKIVIVPFEPPADREYARIRAQLERQGLPISGNDLLIAAQAAARGLIVVTDNVRAFGRIDGLSVENWLRE